MTTPSVYRQQTAVVLLGSFNPRIFEPLWFSRNGLIADAEAEAAEIQLVDSDFCHLALPWVDFTVLDSKLQMATTPETVNDAQLRDLVVGILRLLPHTPVTQGSIHHRADLQLSTEPEWHEVGHRLAPKALWEGILEEPGMFDFAMLGKRPDDLEGAIKVRIRPSPVVHPGIFMNVNDEFIPPTPDENGTSTADLVFGLWPEAEQRATEIRTQLLERLIG